MAKRQIASYFDVSNQTAEVQQELDQAQEQLVDSEQNLAQARERIVELEKLLLGQDANTLNKVTKIVPTSRISRDPEQARYWIDPGKISSLANAIKEVGFRGALWVRLMPDGQLRLVAGERRLRAAIEAGLTKIPVEILDIDSDTALTLSLLENLQREDLNKIEETEAILRLLAKRIGIEVEEVPNLLYRMKNMEEGLIRGIDSPNEEAGTPFEIIQSVFDTLGRITWQSFIRTRLPLRKMPSEILDAVHRSQIDYTKALAIASVKDDEARSKLLKETIKGNLSQKEVQDRIKSLKSKSKVVLKGEFQKVLKIRSSAWEDPAKSNKIQELLRQLKDLLEA